MFDLVRFKPVSGLGRMRDLWSRFFNETMPETYRQWPALRELNMPAVDIIDKKDHFLVKAEVPGYKKEELDISIEGDVLTLKGETKTEKKEEKENYQYRETSLGSFFRSIKLTSEIDKKGIKAALKDGILTLELPKVPEKVPSKISIEAK